MKFGSLFSGIGGFDLGFERAGMTAAWQCEIDAAASGVLSRHWPDVPNYHDVRSINRDNTEAVDVICGGFPCQDVSVAGQRAGLAGERSGLWFEFRRIVDELKPGWVVIENVPGLLSSNGGRDFAVILRGLAECGYGVAYRILDSQYFGVAQRRRRVFVVASLGTGRAAEVLFERESGGGHPETLRAAGQEVAYTLRANPSHSGDKGDGGINTTLVSNTLGSKKDGGYRNDLDTSGAYIVSPTVTSKWAKGGGPAGDEAQNLTVQDAAGVRRLMPVECERLQGFPDGWTAKQADAPRYRQLGNAVTVNVAEWIGRRMVANER